MRCGRFGSRALPRGRSTSPRGAQKKEREASQTGSTLCDEEQQLIGPTQFTSLLTANWPRRQRVRPVHARSALVTARASNPGPRYRKIAADIHLERARARANCRALDYFVSAPALVDSGREHSAGVIDFIADVQSDFCHLCCIFTTLVELLQAFKSLINET